jgi:hypothetical protein
MTGAFHKSNNTSKHIPRSSQQRRNMILELLSFLMAYVARAELDGDPLPLSFAHGYALSLDITSRAARACGTVMGHYSWFRPTPGWTEDLLGVARPGLGGARGALLLAMDNGTISLAPFGILYLTSIGVNFQVSCSISRAPRFYILCSGS